MNLKLEAIVIPVSDVDRAKKFYQEALGFRVDVDHRAAVYEQALGFRHRSELSHCAADAAGIGMLDSDRDRNHAGEAGHISGNVPDRARYRGHPGRARRPRSRFERAVPLRIGRTDPWPRSRAGRLQQFRLAQRPGWQRLADPGSQAAYSRTVRTFTASYKSITTSPLGWEQQISRLPWAGGSSGSGW